MADPASVEEQQKAENELEAIAVGISVSVLAIIASRMMSLDGSVTKAYASMPEDLKAINDVISRGNKALEAKINEIFTRMAKGNDSWAAKYYRVANKEQLSFIDNLRLKALYRNGIKNAIKDARSLTSAMGVVNEDGKFLPIRDAYVEAVGKAAGDMVMGKAAGEDAIRRAVDSLAESGTKVKYANTTRDLYSAVRMNVMGQYKQTMVAMRKVQGDEFGADGVEVTAHSPCAPDHEPWQGRQYTKADFQDIQDELERDIETGANCMHTTYPIILGMSPAISNERLREMNESSWEEVTVTGLNGEERTMTRYQASQYQRRIENSIRKANIKQTVTGQDMSAYIKRTTAAYKDISKKAGLPAMLERTRAFRI